MLKIKYTDEVKAYLESRQVFLERGELYKRQNPTDLTFLPSLKVEQYAGFYAGNSLANFGAFSYSNSPVNPNMEVGRYCSISWGLNITGSRHPLEWLTTSNINFDIHVQNIKKFHLNNGTNRFWVGQPSKLEKPYPKLGNDVWIGQNVTLNRGITIGDGAVVAAFSVVTKDVPPYTIVGGNPAKVIRKRFPDELCERLLNVKWWELHPNEFAFQDMSKPEEIVDFIERRANELEKFEVLSVTAQELEQFK